MLHSFSFSGIKDTIGGTVRLENGIFVLDYVTPASSTLCGAVYLADSFSKLLQDKAKMFFDDLAVLGTAFWQDAIREWETKIMPNYGLDTTNAVLTFRLPPAAIPAVTPRARRTHWRWVERGAIPLYRYEQTTPSRDRYRCLCLTEIRRGPSEEVACILDFAVDKIVDLIQIQIQDLRQKLNKEPKASRRPRRAVAY